MCAAGTSRHQSHACGPDRPIQSFGMEFRLDESTMCVGDLGWLTRTCRPLNDVELHGANTAAVRRVCTVYDDEEEEQQLRPESAFTGRGRHDSH